MSFHEIEVAASRSIVSYLEEALKNLEKQTERNYDMVLAMTKKERLHRSHAEQVQFKKAKKMNIVLDDIHHEVMIQAKKLTGHINRILTSEYSDSD
jgi:hypothetical protein